MNEQPVTVDGDSAFDRIVEEITTAIRSGDSIPIDQYTRQFPEQADRLQDLIVSMKLLAQFGAQESASDPVTVSNSSDVIEQGVLGDFRILREVGRGGMGVVYEAEQISLGRRVALKIFPFASILDDRQLQRFKNEARAAATLNHTNIVPIYFVGVEKGIHFYAMQFVQGQTLQQLVEQLRQEDDSGCVTGSASPQATTIRDLQAELSTQRTQSPYDYRRTIAELAIKVAEGLQHAHEHGIIHRDIKPSNLIVDSLGHCQITDFGLARLESETNLTVTGDVVGTLRYAPPEQVLGKHTLVDHRADIFALGATLYELLALQPARDATNREGLLRQAAEGSTKPLRHYDATVPRDLETIVMKAMEAAPEDRYQSASDMAEDLRRFVAEQPLLVRRPTTLQRLQKWSRRHPQLVAAGVATLALFSLAVSIAAVALNYQRLQILEQRDESRANLRLAISALDEVYHEIGKNWIDRDRALSDVQTHFLIKSANFLNEIAGRFPAKSKFVEDAGLAHLHAANANARLLQFEKAQVGYAKATEFLEKAIAEAPEDVALRESLAAAEFYRGNGFFDAWKFDSARQAYDRAAKHYRVGIGLDPRNESIQSALWTVEVELLRLDSLNDFDENVIRLATSLRTEVLRAINDEPRRTSTHEINLKLASLISQSLRRLGDYSQAKLVCESAYAESAELLQDHADHRRLTRLVAALEAELGRSELDLGELDAAETHLGSALKRLRESFVFDGTPKEFSFAYMAGKATHDQMEPEAYAQYALTQSSLAEVLLKMDRPADAFVVADESVRTCLACFRNCPST